jgi:hypothetical protein
VGLSRIAAKAKAKATATATATAKQQQQRQQIPFGDDKQEKEVQERKQLQRQPTLHDEAVKDGPPKSAPSGDLLGLCG